MPRADDSRADFPCAPCRLRTYGTERMLMAKKKPAGRPSIVDNNTNTIRERRSIGKSLYEQEGTRSRPPHTIETPPPSKPKDGGDKKK